MVSSGEEKEEGSPSFGKLTLSQIADTRLQVRQFRVIFRGLVSEAPASAADKWMMVIMNHCCYICSLDECLFPPPPHLVPNNDN